MPKKVKKTGRKSKDKKCKNNPHSCARPTTVDEELNVDQFRVSIFGSARIQPDDKVFKQVFSLANHIGKEGYDVITGGGPGLMLAATLGHKAGDKADHADAIGLTIELPWEAEANKHLEMKKHFNKFSGRLDHFMALSNVVVVAPGGIGTALELFYTWQLVQVKHICPIPIILLGKMWKQLYKWVCKYPVKEGLVSPGDLDSIYIAKDEKDVMRIIKNAHKVYEKKTGDYCLNINKYRLD